MTIKIYQVAKVTHVWESDEHYYEVLYTTIDKVDVKHYFDNIVRTLSETYKNTAGLKHISDTHAYISTTEKQLDIIVNVTTKEIT